MSYDPELCHCMDLIHVPMQVGVITHIWNHMNKGNISNFLHLFNCISALVNDSRSRNVLTGGVKGVLYNITNTAHIMSFFRKKFNTTENLNDKTSNKIYKINTILHIFAPLNGILIMVFHKCNRRKTPITKDRTDTMFKMDAYMWNDM